MAFIEFLDHQRDRALRAFAVFIARIVHLADAIEQTRKLLFIALPALFAIVMGLTAGDAAANALLIARTIKIHLEPTGEEAR